ncbi:MAG TPA: MFS transporter [Exilispira sp.]|nr:MFS transporter [Exilispira sp.]
MASFNRFFSSYKKVINKKFFIIYFIYFSFFLANGPLETSIPLLFEHYGFHGNIYGAFLSTNSIINIILPSFIAYMAHRFSSMLFGMIAMLIGFFGAILAGCLPSCIYTVYPACLMIMISRTVFNYSYGNAINYSIESDSRGKYFAIRDLFLFGSISIGMFLGSIITSKTNVSVLFFGFSFIFFIPMFFIKRTDKNIAKVQIKEETISRQSNGDDKKDKNQFLSVIKNKYFWGFLLVGFGSTIYTTSLFFLPLLGTSIGISVPKILSMFGAITLVNSIVAILIGNVSDFINRKWLFVFDNAFDIIPALIFAFTTNTYLFIAGIVCTMIKDAFAPSSFAYLYDCFQDKKGIVVQGFLSSIDNALSFVAPLLIGILWNISKKWVFLLGASGCLFSSIIAIITLPDVISKK